MEDKNMPALPEDEARKPEAPQDTPEDALTPDVPQAEEVPQEPEATVEPAGDAEVPAQDAEAPQETMVFEIPQEDLLSQMPEISDEMLEQDSLDEEDPDVSEEIAGFVEDNFFTEAPSLSDEPSDEELLSDEALLQETAFADPFIPAGPIISADPIVQDTPTFYAPEAPADHDGDYAATIEEAFPDEYNEMKDMNHTEDETQRKARPAHKGRPKRKKGPGLLGIPHLIAACIWLAIIVAIGLSLGRLIWVCAADVLAFGREDKEVTITITADDTIDTITTKLQNAGLIRYADLFKLYANLSNAQEDIVTGTFTLNTNYDYHALVNEMSSNASNRAEITVQIPEGYNCRQIFQLLEEKGVCTVAELEEYAANGELDDYWFLEGVERGDKYCLEGYLFPDTYNFFTYSSPRAALEKMLSGFNHRFTDDMQAQIVALNEHISEKMRKNGESDEYIASHQFTLKEVVIVASLIEEESANPTESPSIASVIYNRLFSWGDTPRYLNIDAALIYATGDSSNIDTSTDSPYNTYTHLGLTPGPISNPGVSSLQAALSPASTSYYYYVLDPSIGEHIFSKTLEDHEKQIAKIEAKMSDE
ncbi:MAG: endolytic transglycosylase MltG [Oscillospiraceae bacterium]|nr:endolytic transglycosylase MltG [Oscillospiraceae bacterium]